jgi:hypothetical protein
MSALRPQARADTLAGIIVGSGLLGDGVEIVRGGLDPRVNTGRGAKRNGGPQPAVRER